MAELPINHFSLEILQSLPDALLVTKQDGQIVFVNTQLLVLFAYRQEELIGQSLDILMPQRFRQAHQRHVAEYAHTPYTRPMGDCSGFYGLRSSAEEFPVEIYLSPLNLDGHLFLMAAVRDISARKQLEDELHKSRDQLEERVKIRTAELEQTAQRLQTEIHEHARSEKKVVQLQTELSHIARLSLIGEMVSGLGHEINQPLTAINNYAQGCIRRLHAGKADHGELIDALQRLSRETSRASDIITRFRRFAKKEQLQRQWTGIDTLLCDAVRLSELEFSRHGVTVELRLSGLMPQIFIDALQIQQVIVNLVRNAIESTLDRPQGQRRVTLQLCTPQDDNIEIQVQDSGHGLLAESVEHLFHTFFTTKPNGLGMGLSLSRRIVEAHGGQLTAQTNSDQGMTFSVILPVCAEAAHVC